MAQHYVQIMCRSLLHIYKIEKTFVNVLFPALTLAHKNITFSASTLKQKSYAERNSQLSGSLRSVSAVQ